MALARLRGTVGLVATIVAGCASSPAQPGAAQPASPLAAPSSGPMPAPSTSVSARPRAANAAGDPARADDRVAPDLDARESAVLAELAAADARELERFRQRLGVGSPAAGTSRRGAEGTTSALGTAAGAPAPRPVARAALASGAPAGAEAFVARRDGRLRRCYALARAADPTTGAGIVHVEVAREAGGAVRVAVRRAGGGPFPDALLACVEDVMRVPGDRDPAAPWAFAVTVTFDLE